MRNIPIHKTQDSGYFEPTVNTYCGLGDGYDKGFLKGTIEWDKVTCKRCLKNKSE